MANIKWESVPDFGGYYPQGSLAELECRSRQNKSRFDEDLRTVGRVESVKTVSTSGIELLISVCIPPYRLTTAAIINLLHIITNMLLSNPYVIVISLDFSKAFDIVPIAHNAPVYGGHTSSQKSITAGIINQGSGIGPAAYVVTAGDLKPITVDNKLIKFADDTYYLIIPASNTFSGGRQH